MKHDVDLVDLFRGDDDREAAAPEIKTRIRWAIFEKAPVGNENEVEIQGIEDVPEDDDRAVLRRCGFCEVRLDGIGIEVDADGRVDWKQDCNDILKGGDQDLEQLKKPAGSATDPAARAGTPKERAARVPGRTSCRPWRGEGISSDATKLHEDDERI